MTDAVITETRTEITTEEVTETRYRCHVCEMVYEENEVISIGLDRSEMPETTFFSGAVEPRTERIVCRHCTDGLFDYEVDEDSTLSEPARTFELDWVTATGAAAAVMLLVGIPLAVVSGVVGAVSGSGLFVPAVLAAFAAGFGLGVAAL